MQFIKVFLCADMIELLRDIIDAKNIKGIRMDSVTIPADQHEKWENGKEIAQLNLQFFKVYSIVKFTSLFKSGDVDERLFNVKFLEDFASDDRFGYRFYVKTTIGFPVRFKTRSLQQRGAE